MACGENVKRRSVRLPLGRMTGVRTLRLAALAVASVAVLAATAGGSRGAAPPLRGVNFISVCGFSHRGPDDPIVLPRQPGFSHDHTFVGNDSTNAFSTPAQLRTAGTTCRRAGDKAAYWMPTLFAGGQALTPTTAIAYYRRTGEDGTAARSRQASRWSPGTRTRRPAAAQHHLLGLRRPGERPTVRQHPQLRRRPAQPARQLPGLLGREEPAVRQPEEHGVLGERPLPEGLPGRDAGAAARLPVPEAPTGSIELASGGQYSGHADFINAWDQKALTALVAGCLNKYRHCGTGS